MVQTGFLKMTAMLQAVTIPSSCGNDCAQRVVYLVKSRVETLALTFGAALLHIRIKRSIEPAPFYRANYLFVSEVTSYEAKTRLIYNIHLKYIFTNTKD